MALEVIRPPRPVRGGELLLVALVALLYMGLTLLPYAYAQEATPRGYQYMWWLWGPDEGNTYLAWMRQAADGSWLLGNKFLPPHTGTQALFCNVLLVAGGRLAHALSLPLIAVYHGLRVVSGVFCLTAFYALVGLAFERRPVRVTALLLAMFSAGLGWAVELIAGPQAAAQMGAVDFSSHGQVMPEAITGLSLLLNPLFAAGAGLICLSLALGLLALRRQSLWFAAACGLALGLLANIHTYDIFVVAGTLGVLLLSALKARAVRSDWAVATVLLVALLSAPGWGWQLWVMHADPEYAAKAHTPTLSPSLEAYLLGYGLLIGFALLAVGHLYRWRGYRPRESYVFLIWTLVNIPLLYAPVAFQRKMAEGLHLALCGLAAAGICLVLGPLTAVTTEVGSTRQGLARARTRFVALVAVCVLATAPSLGFFIADVEKKVETNNADLPLMPPVYLSDLQVQALDWLSTEARPTDVVLSTNLIGSYVPGRTGAYVVAGHWAETLHFSEAIGAVSTFFEPDQRDAARRYILDATRATWVYLGPYEKLVGRAAARDFRSDTLGSPEVSVEELEALPELTLRFRNGEVALFEIEAARGTGRRPGTQPPPQPPPRSP